MPNCPHPTTRESGVCKQCAVERAHEGVDGQPPSLDAVNPECTRCDTEINGRVCYHPNRPGVVLCDECHDEVSESEACFVTDGGQNHAQTMGLARMHLCQAITRSSDGQVLTTMEHLEEASEHLETAGFDEAASVVDDIAEGDVCDSQTRYDLRQLAQMIDAWANKLFERFLRDQQLEPEVRP